MEPVPKQCAFHGIFRRMLCETVLSNWAGDRARGPCRRPGSSGRQVSQETPEPLVLGVRRVANAEGDLRAVGEDAAGVGVGSESPPAPGLPPPRAAATTQGPNGDKGC